MFETPQTPLTKMIKQSTMNFPKEAKQPSLNSKPNLTVHSWKAQVLEIASKATIITRKS
jgi:hypothetical protein